MKLFILFTLLSISIFSFTQNLTFYRSQIDTLCNDTMYGRGYLKDGHKVAANYIQEEFEKFQLDVIQQDFQITVNTFPQVSSIIIDDTIILTVGKDFIPSPISGTISGDFKLLELDSIFFISPSKERDFLNENLSNTVLVYHQDDSDKLSNEVKKKMAYVKGIIVLKPTNLLGSFHAESLKIGMIDLLATSYPKHAHKISINIESRIEKITSQNVIASPLKFKKKLPTILITAHYDHLGGYGDSCFVPGANDNASGVAMILDMARHFNNKPIQANLVFIACGGEEVGLIGSSYYTEHPTIPLDKIDLVLNFDLMGAGSKGIMVQNGIEHSDVYEAFVKENNKCHYVPIVKKRGNSPNSDHYPFTQKGVKALFIYSFGDVGGYHNILDTKEYLEYGSYESLYKLIVSTIEDLLIDL